jgi:triacylglycerol lipase
MFVKRSPPKPSLWLVTHPESDAQYVHFQPQMADGSIRRAVDVTPFEPSASVFSPVNAWWLAEAALLSYWDTASVATRLNEQADVWSDINFLPVRWEKGGNVHEGFAAALDAVWELIAARLRSLPGRTVWFTGHSLGAAVATLAADRFGAPGGVYTLGSPRVGDDDFVSEFNARQGGRSFRYVNNHDVVTHVPPSRLGFGHVDSERHFDDGGRMAAVSVRGAEVLAAAAKYLSVRIDLIVSGASVIPPGVIDHTPRRYTTFVWNAFVDAFVQA